jgi:hypothetical protein
LGALGRHGALTRATQRGRRPVVPVDLVGRRRATAPPDAHDVLPDDG